VKLSAALETLHLATLVHDDIIDDAKTRRGAETIQIKFGKHPAVICGDYLFCLPCSSHPEFPQVTKKIKVT
jgi:heptaprenyl diphosphate synthase